MQRAPHAFIKNEKERKNVAFFWKEQMPNPENVAFDNPFFYFFVPVCT